jgi:hypothetical protein
MSPLFWQAVHVVSALLLTAFTAYIIGRSAPETRKLWLTVTGALAILVLVAGMGLWGKVYAMTPHFWIIGKIVCWLGLAAVGGIAYKRQEKRSLWLALTVVFATGAVLLAYTGRSA